MVPAALAELASNIGRFPTNSVQSEIPLVVVKIAVSGTKLFFHVIARWPSPKMAPAASSPDCDVDAVAPLAGLMLFEAAPACLSSVEEVAAPVRR